MRWSKNRKTPREEKIFFFGFVSFIINAFNQRIFCIFYLIKKSKNFKSFTKLLQIWKIWGRWKTASGLGISINYYLFVIVRHTALQRILQLCFLQFTLLSENGLHKKFCRKTFVVVCFFLPRCRVSVCHLGCDLVSALLWVQFDKTYWDVEISWFYLRFSLPFCWEFLI